MAPFGGAALKGNQEETAGSHRLHRAGGVAAPPAAPVAVAAPAPQAPQAPAGGCPVPPPITTATGKPAETIG